MTMKSLKIGDLVAKLPIIQGGMGIGVSRSNLAQAVANCGGVGVISAAQIGFDEEDFVSNPLKANLRSLAKHIIQAKEMAKSGIIGVNIMVAMNHYEEYVKQAIESGIDLIISGAGLPTMLPKLVEGTKVKIAPIVSSVKAMKTILKVWDVKHKQTADLVVFEGPKAGGHLGYTVDQLNNSFDMDETIKALIEEVKPYEEKYQRKIPIIVAGGVYSGQDIKHVLDLGAGGVQMASRFIGTDECDADIRYKEAFVKCQEEDIEIVSSPVGMPGRAIKTKLTETIKKQQVKVKKCYSCLKDCDVVSIPYCITTALINAVKGNIEDGLLFCGSNAYKIKEIIPVSQLFNQIELEYNS